MMDDIQSVERSWMTERVTLFHRLVGTLAVVIVATFVLMAWGLGRPSSHDENNAAASSAAAAWPDGSKKTSNDWWAKAEPGQPPAHGHSRPDNGRPS